jgi:hypothetical protein
MDLGLQSVSLLVPPLLLSGANHERSEKTEAGAADDGLGFLRQIPANFA